MDSDSHLPFIATGRPAAGIHRGHLTFLNHGCNATANARNPVLSASETIDKYDPYAERHFSCLLPWLIAIRDVEPGEEIADRSNCIYIVRDSE
jgi:hypothetical protein